MLACPWWLGLDGEGPNQVDVANRAGTDPKMTSEVCAELARRAVGVVEDADASFFGPPAIAPSATSGASVRAPPREDSQHGH